MVTPQRSTLLRNYMAVTGSLRSAALGGKLLGYSGPATSPDVAVSGSAQLLLTVSKDGGSTGLSFEAATSDGYLHKLASETWEGVVSNPNGLSLDFFRLVNSSGQCLMQLPAVLSGDGVRVATLTPPDGETQPVMAFQTGPSLGVPVQLSLALRNAMCVTGSLRTILNLCKLKVYADTPPASVEDALSGQSLLATITNDGTATGLTFEATANGGVLTKKVGEVWRGIISNAGEENATFWRIENAGGAVMMQGTVGISTGQLRVGNAAPIDGAYLTVALFNYSLAA